MASIIDIPAGAVSRKPMAVILLVDVSDSMNPVGIEQANQGIRDYIEEMQRNEETRDSVHLILVKFSKEATTLIDYKAIRDVVPPTLSSESATNLGEGLREVLRAVAKHTSKIRDGKEPLFVLITDGNPTDETKWMAELAKLNGDPWVGRRPSGRAAGYRVIAGAGSQINDAVLEAFRHDPQKSVVVRLKDLATIGEFFDKLKTLTVEVSEAKPISRLDSPGMQPLLGNG